MPKGLLCPSQCSAVARSPRLTCWFLRPAEGSTLSTACSSLSVKQLHLRQASQSFACQASSTKQNQHRTLQLRQAGLQSLSEADCPSSAVTASCLQQRAGAHKTARSTLWSAPSAAGLQTESGPPAVADSSWHTTPAEQAAGLEFRTVAFYHLVDIAAPEEMVQRHREKLNGLDFCGRIYISRQGINAQFSAPTAHALSYVHWVASEPQFQGLRWNADPVGGHMFPRLRLAAKPNLVQLSGGMGALPITDAKARAKPVAPREWQQLLRNAQQLSTSPVDTAHRPILLDVRNGYEWDAGHFDGAPRPLEDNFVDTPISQIPEALRGADPATTPVMMYCTGGIRCDVYSTHLRRLGFQNLMSLEGGVQNYLKQAGSDRWRGSLFVFDGRMAIAAGVDNGTQGMPAAAPCAACGGHAQLPHLNCANVDCNRLFLACPSCAAHLQGCCCRECMRPARLLRPMKEVGHYNLYGRWHELVPPEEGAHGRVEGTSPQAAAMAAGRGPGRGLRRQRRAEKLQAVYQARRTEREARKAMAKEAMAEQAQLHDQTVPGDADAAL